MKKMHVTPINMQLQEYSPSKSMKQEPKIELWMKAAYTECVNCRYWILPLSMEHRAVL